jgi:hypothetical protein
LSDITTAFDPRPKTLRKDVIYACEASTVIALSVSVELNIFQHVKLGHMFPLIGWTVGFAVPLLVAFLSHVAAHVKFHLALQIWVGGIVAALMFASASAGIKVLTPGMGALPAGVASYGLDLAALTALGVLMYSASQSAALAQWEARQEARRAEAEREARERAEQAEREVLAARYGRPGNRGSTPAIGGGNTPVITAGNVPGNAPTIGGGNTLALTAGNGPGRATAPGAPVLPGGETAAVEVPGEQGSGLASVSPIRRPVATDDEIRKLAEALADELAAQGKTLSVRAYTDRFGGKTARISPIVAEVKAARDAAAAGGVAGAR